MTTIRLAVICALVSFVGCSTENAREQRTLNNLPKYPAHWSNNPGQGIDSRVGKITSTESALVISYDIGHLAGEYADKKAYPKCQWARSAALDGTVFQYLLDKNGTLYVTFSSEGPANFWVKTSDQSEIDYVVELLARYRDRIVPGIVAGTQVPAG